MSLGSINSWYFVGETLHIVQQLFCHNIKHSVSTSTTRVWLDYRCDMVYRALNLSIFCAMENVMFSEAFVCSIITSRALSCLGSTNHIMNRVCSSDWYLLCNMPAVGLNGLFWPSGLCDNAYCPP